MTRTDHCNLLLTRSGTLNQRVQLPCRMYSMVGGAHRNSLTLIRAEPRRRFKAQLGPCCIDQIVVRDARPASFLPGQRALNLDESTIDAITTVRPNLGGLGLHQVDALLLVYRGKRKQDLLLRHCSNTNPDV